MTLDKANGTKGDHAVLWTAFSEAALALLRSGEDPFALIALIPRIVDSHWDEEDRRYAAK